MRQFVPQYKSTDLPGKDFMARAPGTVICILDTDNKPLITVQTKSDPKLGRADTPLPADVLEEAASPDFRAELLDCTLRQVRRQRHLRQWNQGLLAAAFITVLGFLAWNTRAPKDAQQGAPAETLEIVTSQPLSPAMIVQSSPGLVKMINSSASALVVIETSPFGDGYRELNDEELLAFTAGKPSVLVRRGPHQAELLIVDSAFEVAPADKLTQ
jgi:hypothetical protein